MSDLCWISVILQLTQLGEHFKNAAAEIAVSAPLRAYMD